MCSYFLEHAKACTQQPHCQQICKTFTSLITFSFLSLFAFPGMKYVTGYKQHNSYGNFFVQQNIVSETVMRDHMKTLCLSAFQMLPIRKKSVPNIEFQKRSQQYLILCKDQNEFKLKLLQ